MEDQSITTTISTPETLVGSRIHKIKELVENCPGLIIRPIKLSIASSQSGGTGFIIQPESRKTWLILIEPYSNKMFINGSHQTIPFDDKSESIILSKILKYYHE
jgi:hypothetical protein